MRSGWFSLGLTMCLSSGAFAFPGPVRGTEDIPKMMAESALVCKGEVAEAELAEASAPSFVLPSAGMASFTETAYVLPDRCFKGSAEPPLIPIIFNGFDSGSNASVVLRKGDYRLFFLKPQNGKYEVVDMWFGILSVSRERDSASVSSDGSYALELDLKAGLRDPNRERVLDSIRMLGNMKHLRSTSELTQLNDHSNLLVRTYVWQALLRLKDYSVLPAVSKFFDSQPTPPHDLLLPRDRLFEMQYEIANEIGVIRDPATLGFLERFAVGGKAYGLRMNALQALRAIGSPRSAAAFLKALDDSNSDNAFSAMQGLLSLAGGGPIAWAPTWQQFNEAPEFYAAKCREWWETEGRRKILSNAPTSRATSIGEKSQLHQ
jgi:hypothetical protein